ncbi:MAG: CinA family protein [Nocardioides sp.]
MPGPDVPGPDVPGPGSAPEPMEVVARQVMVLLARVGGTLATAESLTGGRLAASLTAVPGASAVYRGGFVTYATELKMSLLGVPAELVDRHGVVSAECAEWMATGAIRVAGSTYAVSTTGVAGPDPADGQPVGLAFVGVSGPHGSVSVRLDASGTRVEIQDRVCRDALGELREILRREAGGVE